MTYQPDPFETYRASRGKTSPHDARQWEREELARKIMSGEVRIIGKGGVVLGELHRLQEKRESSGTPARTR